MLCIHRSTNGISLSSEKEFKENFGHMKIAQKLCLEKKYKQWEDNCLLNFRVIV